MLFAFASSGRSRRDNYVIHTTLYECYYSQTAENFLGAPLTLREADYLPRILPVQVITLRECHQDDDVGGRSITRTSTRSLLGKGR
jgi:hypothetical protein